MTDDDLPDNVLFDWYDSLFGDPESETDVYLGFGLFFIGLGLAAIAAVVFFAGVVAFGFREDPYFIFATVAFSAALLSLPLALLGVDVLLPIEQKAVIASVAGVVITVAATIAFGWSYPDQWAEFDAARMLAVLGTYAVGLTVVAAATGAALIAQQLERAQAPAPSEIEPKADEEPEESYSDEEIRSDIEEAMDGVDMTWGGVEKSENKRLSFTSDFETDVDKSAFDNIEANKTIQDGGVDAQVTGLKQMKGGETKTATSESTVDDQTAALRELKKQKEQDEVPDDAPVAEQNGFFGRLLSKLGLS